VSSGPVLIGYDGTRASEHALRESAELLAGRSALVVVVWKPGLAFDLLGLPSNLGLPPVPLDVRTVLEVDRAQYEAAQEGAQRAAQLARNLGLQAEPLLVADEPEVTVADTLLRLARERDVQALVVGAAAHDGLLGDTSRSLLRHAQRPVVVIPVPGS
jgi:nucleotide-binding universal stress UspA family protein